MACEGVMVVHLVNNVKSEQSTRIMSDFRCIAWENRSTSGFFHRYRCLLAFFGKRRTGCSACCDWKSLHCAGGIGQKNQLAPCVSVNPNIRQGEICIHIWVVAHRHDSGRGILGTLEGQCQICVLKCKFWEFSGGMFTIKLAA